AHAVAAELQTSDHSALLRSRIAAHLDDAAVLAGIEPSRNAPVHDVNGPADRAAAEEQRRRAPQDLDLICEHRFDGHCVILTQAGHIERAHAVVKHEHALSAESADHRATCARAEIGCAHT